MAALSLRIESLIKIIHMNYICNYKNLDDLIIELFKKSQIYIYLILYGRDVFWCRENPNGLMPIWY